jgi:lactoylglutathione lyase
MGKQLNNCHIANSEARVLHTMIRVGNLDRSIHFYTQIIGMQLLRKEDYPDGLFTLAFVGYGDECSGATIELTYNWGKENMNTAQHLVISQSQY